MKEFIKNYIHLKLTIDGVYVCMGNKMSVEHTYYIKCLLDSKNSIGHIRLAHIKRP